MEFDIKLRSSNATDFILSFHRFQSGFAEEYLGAHRSLLKVTDEWKSYKGIRHVPVIGKVSDQDSEQYNFFRLSLMPVVSDSTFELDVASADLSSFCAY